MSDLFTLQHVEYMYEFATNTIPATIADVRQWAAERGLALVPIKPRQRQKHAAEKEIANWCSSSRQSRHHQIAERIYDAMVAAYQEEMNDPTL